MKRRLLQATGDKRQATGDRGWFWSRFRFCGRASVGGVMGVREWW